VRALSLMLAVLAALLPSAPASADERVLFDTFESTEIWTSTIRAAARDGSGVATIYSSTSLAGLWLGSTAYPRWSPDRTQVLFRGSDAALASQLDSLFLVPAAGGAPVNLTAAMPIQSLLTGASWAPNGRQVTFVGEADPLTGAPWNDEIYVLGTRNGSWRQLTDDADGQSKFFPVFSPDGSQVAYTWDSAGGVKLAVVPAAGGRARVLDTQVQRRAAVSWSPDGRYIAYAKFDPTGTYTDAFTVEVKSGRKRNLTRGAFGGAGNPWWAGTVMYPTFSPAGGQVAFAYLNPVQQGAEPGELWVVPAQGGATRRLAMGVAVYQENGIGWSGDGREIAYVAILGPSANPNHLFQEAVGVVEVAGGATRIAAGPFDADVNTPLFR